MSDEVSDVAIRDIVRRRAADMGGVSALAAEAGVSQTFIYNVISGRKAPGNRVLAFLGYEEVTRRTYRRRQETEA